MGASGSGEIDFGAWPGAYDASLAITGQAGIVAGSLVEAWVFPKATADHSADEHMVEDIFVYADASTIVAATGFTIRAFCKSPVFQREPKIRRDDFNNLVLLGLYGKYSVGWVWV